MRRKKYDYLIVGAGINGAVFAHEMTKKGKRCLVVEKRGHVGGNCFDMEIAGVRIHRYGAHIFHTSNKTVWNYVNQFASFNHFINSPVANYHGEIYNLPFNMNTFSKLWGVSTPMEAEAILEKQRVHYDHEPMNLEEQGLSLAGRDIFEKLIRGYTEKQWGRDCKELPPEILKRIPFRFLYDNNYFNDLYQGIPENGYTAMTEAMLDGIEVCCNTDYLENRQNLNELADKIFYTGTIDAFFDYKEGPLEYRSLRFEDEYMEIPNAQGVAVMNYTDTETPYTRIIEHKHFSFGQQPNTVITREYPVKWECGMEPYYPINDKQNRKLYSRYWEMAKTQPDVIFCGRLASYRYYNMDQAIKSALEAAEKEQNENWRA